MLSLANSSYLQTAAKLEGTMEFSHEDIQMAEQDFNVASLMREVQELSVSLRSLREKYPHDHQIVRDVASRRRAAETELDDKRDEIIRRNLNAAIGVYGNQIESAQRMLEQHETELAEQDLQLRELASKQSTYEALRERREYLEASRDGDMQLLKEIQLLRYRTDAARVRIAERAMTPRGKAFPRAEIMIPLGFLLMTGLAIGVIFLRELTDQRVKTASDLAVMPGARILGVVPEASEDPTKVKSAEMAIRRYPNSVIAESYRQACAPLIKAMDLSGYQTVMFASGLPSAGNSTVVTNVAAGCAATGRTVVVVDANFRRPRVAEIMGQEPDETGLGDVLLDQAKLEDVIRSGEYGVCTVTVGTPGSRVVDRLNAESLDRVIAELRSRFDLVLFDAPPAVVAGETMVLASRVARLINQVNDTGCQLLGLMLNRPRGTAGGYLKKNYATMAAYGGKSA
jgi:MinD-like ATPase involved in chromosome partitioning or flagellar assembly